MLWTSSIRRTRPYDGPLLKDRHDGRQICKDQGLDITSLHSPLVYVNIERTLDFIYFQRRLDDTEHLYDQIVSDDQMRFVITVIYQTNCNCKD